MYHERQRLRLCAVHAANNLVGHAAFSREDFELVARELNPASIFWNPHRGLGGNFCVNTLVIVLQKRQLEVAWHDARKPLSPLVTAPPAGFVGFIANRHKSSLFGLWDSHHWFSIGFRASVDSGACCWFNQDSNLARPEPFADAAAVVDFVARLVNDGGQLLIVTSRRGGDENDDGGRSGGGSSTDKMPP